MAGGYISGLDAAGTLTGDELLEISQLSATVTISAATISAQASDNSFNDSGSGFVAAGFAVGMRVRVAGFTGNVANNILVGTITALAGGKMTIGGTDGDVIVDDAAGETVTISQWESRRASAQDIADLGGGGGGTVTECLIVALADETTAITTGAAKVTIYAPYDFTITEVWIGLTTVSSSGAVTVDVNDAGSTIFGTNPSIVAGQETNLTGGGTAGAISGSTHFVSKGDKITFDIDAAGTGAKGAKAYLIGHQ